MMKRKRGRPPIEEDEVWLHRLSETYVDLEEQRGQPPRRWISGAVLRMLRGPSDDDARRIEQDNAVKRLQKKWRKEGTGRAADARERRAQARAATAAPSGGGGLGYGVERLAGLPLNRTIQEIAKEVRVPMPIEVRAVEEARRLVMSPAFQAEMEMRRTFERLGPNPAMLEMQRQIDLMRFIRGY